MSEYLRPPERIRQIEGRPELEPGKLEYEPPERRTSVVSATEQAARLLQGAARRVSGVGVTLTQAGERYPEDPNMTIPEGVTHVKILSPSKEIDTAYWKRVNLMQPSIRNTQLPGRLRSR